MHGRFITFEGGEGSGKSTQAKLLASRLRSLAVPVLLTREPGGSPGAEAIRHVLLAGAAKPLGAHAEAILFAAARDDHVRQTIRPALAAGTWVISDRFADSTRIYQGTLSNVDPRLIRRLERITVGDTKPDLTLVLDAPTDLGLARAASRRGNVPADRFETERLEFYKKLQEGYRDLVQREPERCALIDACADTSTVAAAIWAVVNARLDPAEAAVIIEDAVP
jgi:dTMP kinase